MRDIVEIHEFFVQGTDTDQTHVLLHISEPSADEENKGYFFALCEIINRDEKVISQVQKMIDEVEANYYDTGSEEKKNAFEQSIEAINRRSHQVLQNSVSKIHLLFGVIENNKIYFASRGPISAHLIYHKGQELRHVNVNQEKKTPLDQIFSSLVEGEIRVDDYFFITTDLVEKYFPLDRVQKILLQKDTKSSSLHIQKTLEQVNSDSSLSGIIIHRPTEENIPRFKKLPKIARSSHSKISNEQNIFANTLSALSKKINAQKSENGIFNPQPKKFLEQDTPKSHILPKNLPRPLIILLNGLSIIIVAFIQIFRVFFTQLFHLFRFLFILCTNRRGERASALHEFRIDIREKIYFLKRLPFLSKILLILCTLSLIAFFISIALSRHHEQEQLIKSNYEQQISEIKNKKDLAESKILYQDTDNAFTILQEAKKILADLQNNPKKNDVELQSLEKEIETSLSALRKETEIQTTLKADIGATFLDAQTQTLIRLDNTLVAFSQNDKSYYFINLDTGNIIQKNHETLPNLFKGNAPKEYDKIVFTIDQNRIAEYTVTTDSLSTKDIVFPLEGVNLQDIFVYNRKLYSLDTNNNQIYRHNQTQTGYDKGTAWITDAGIDIKNASSLTIDGDVYVLQNNGEILKFSAGKKQPFTIAALDPALTSPTQIWTYNDVKNIYILEPKTKRVVVIDKNGTLIKQYTSENWVNPTSMVVDEARSTIYILDSNKIYSFPL